MSKAISTNVIEALLKDIETVDEEGTIVLHADGTGTLTVNEVPTPFYSVEELVERVNDAVYGGQGN